MKRIILITVSVLLCLFGRCQMSNIGYDLPGVVENGDTIAVVHVPKVYIFPTLKFASKDDYYRYKKLVRDVKKVYPYSQIAKTTFKEIEDIMDSLPNDRLRKKYIKAKEDELLDRYYDELFAMTVHQGEILLKLINRELNRSAHDIIKELRGGFSAIMWQSMAKVFGESLKTSYDPNGEDKMIERIVVQIEQGVI